MVPVSTDVLLDLQTYFNYLFFITGHFDAKVVSAGVLVGETETLYSIELSSLEVAADCWKHTNKLFHRHDGRRTLTTGSWFLYNTNMRRLFDHSIPGVDMAHTGKNRSFILTLLRNNGYAFDPNVSNFTQNVRIDAKMLNAIQHLYHEHMLLLIGRVKDPIESQAVFQSHSKRIQLEIGRLLGQ